MSVLIKGIEMPKENQRGLWVVIHADGIVEYDSGDEGWKTLKQAAYPVPPHGRLIDSDALEAKGYCLSKLNIDFDAPAGKQVWRECVTFDDAPTIIPAEEGE